jgi:hypothetical protein
LTDIVNKVTVIERTLKINAEPSIKGREVLHKGADIGDLPTTTTKGDSTQPLEGTQLLNSPIIREEVVSALRVRLVEKCIMGDAGLDSRVVIGMVDQDTLLRIAGPLPATQPIKIAQGNNRILRLHVCMP